MTPEGQELLEEIEHKLAMHQLRHGKEDDHSTYMLSNNGAKRVLRGLIERAEKGEENGRKRSADSC